MRQRQKRQPARRDDVAAYLKAHGGNLQLARKSAKYVAKTGGLFDDVAGLKELRDVLFAPGESAGALDRRIAEVERGPQT